MLDKIYIIHLKRSVHRHEHMLKQMEKQNIENYLFFDAIDAENDDLNANYDFSVISKWRDPFSRKCITRGEIGCALTHYWVWEEIVSNQYSQVLILEDDVVLEDDFIQKLKKIEVPKDMDFLYVGRRDCMSKEPEQEVNKDIVIPKYSYGLHGYILTLEGAKKLLSYSYLQNIFPVDEFLPMIYDKKYPHAFVKKHFPNVSMNCYCLKNNLVKLHPFESNTFHTSPYLVTQEDSFVVLSMAKKETDGYKRFVESCQTYGHTYKILGLNTEWKDDSYKLLLLFQELSSWTIEKLENTLVCVTDCDSVIITSHEFDIIQKYKSFKSDKVLFLAENTCLNMGKFSEHYPECDSEYKYLNAGGFIGYGHKIYELLNYSLEQIVPSHLKTLFQESDYCVTDKWLMKEQLLYTFLYLQKKIILDTKCVLFQSLLNTKQDLHINNNWSITNKKTNTNPFIIHGCGDETVRLILNKVSNYLVNGWSPAFHCTLTKEVTELPIVFIYCKTTFKNELSYPKEKIILYHEKDFVQKFLDSEAEYFFYFFNDYIIENPNTLNILLKTKKDIIAPMYVKPHSSWSNFWGDLNQVGYYQRSFDYSDIISYNRKGIFNVPYIQDCYLLHKQVLKDYPDLYEKKLHEDPDLSVCKYFRNENKFMFVTNLEKFISENNEVNIYEYNFNWKSKYIHPNVLSEWNDLGNDVFEFPLFTPEFCKKLITICNDKNEWSPGKDCKEIDKRIGAVEPVPTVDIHLKQIGLDTIWKNIVEEIIKPLVYTKFQFTTKQVLIAFVVKYSTDGQKELKPHHDNSSYTINVCLNDEYEGGGCRFVRQNKIVNNKKIGYCTLHPGKLTHLHEGLTVTSGLRYVFISFIH